MFPTPVIRPPERNLSAAAKFRGGFGEFSAPVLPPREAREDRAFQNNDHSFGSPCWNFPNRLPITYLAIPGVRGAVAESDPTRPKRSNYSRRRNSASLGGNSRCHFFGPVRRSMGISHHAEGGTQNRGICDERLGNRFDPRGGMVADHQPAGRTPPFCTAFPAAPVPMARRSKTS